MAQVLIFNFKILLSQVVCTIKNDIEIEKIKKITEVNGLKIKGFKEIFKIQRRLSMEIFN